MLTKKEFLEYATDMIDGGQAKEVIEMCYKFLQEGEDAEIYFYLAVAKAEDNYTYEEVLETYTKAIEIDPKFIDAYYDRGVFKMDNEDLHGALEDLSKILEINPKLSYVLDTMADIKIRLYDYKGALDCYNFAIKNAPTFIYFIILSIKYCVLKIKTIFNIK